jgi:hypothetical protein
MAEEDNGTDEFIGALLGELDEQIELSPVVDGIEAGTRTRGHRCLRRYAPLALPRGQQECYVESREGRIIAFRLRGDKHV